MAPSSFSFLVFMQHCSAALTPFNPVPFTPLINLLQNPGPLIVALDPCTVPNLKRKFQRVKCRRCLLRKITRTEQSPTLFGHIYTQLYRTIEVQWKEQEWMDV